MKMIQLFTKTPSHKKFSYMPRHYDPLEEERKERELRIREELKLTGDKDKEIAVEQERPGARIAGSFKKAKKTATVQADPSANMMRLIILLIITAGLIGFLQFGQIAIYGVVLVIVPLYLYLKFRKISR